MPKIGYCAECGCYVDLSPSGACGEGHPRSALRDVQEGSVAAAPVVGVARRPRDPALHDYDSLTAQVLGKGIVIVPVALILALGLWSGFEEFTGTGMSFWAKLGLSALSLALTIGGAFLLLGRRRH